MTAAETTVNVQKVLMENCTAIIHIKGLRKVRFRLWLGMALMRLVAWILPVKTVICDCDKDMML